MFFSRVGRVWGLILDKRWYFLRYTLVGGDAVIVVGAEHSYSNAIDEVNYL